MIATLFFALLIPVAGHGYETSGTSPLRHMVAVVPLAAVPIAVWLRSMRGRTLPLAFAVALMLISIQMAAAYNLRNDKTITQTITAGISGWDPSFTFPLLRRTEQPGFDRRSLMVWEALSLAAVAGGFWWRSGLANRTGRVSPSFAFGTSLAIVSLAGMAAIAAGGPRRELRLLETPAQSLSECRMGCVDQSRIHPYRIGTRLLRATDPLARPAHIDRQQPRYDRSCRRPPWIGPSVHGRRSLSICHCTSRPPSAAQLLHFAPRCGSQ